MLWEIQTAISSPFNNIGRSRYLKKIRLKGGVGVSSQIRNIYYQVGSMQGEVFIDF